MCMCYNINTQEDEKQVSLCTKLRNPSDTSTTSVLCQFPGQGEVYFVFVCFFQNIEKLLAKL